MHSSRLGYQAGLIGFIRPTTMLRLAHRLPTVSRRRALRLGGILAGSLAGAPLASWEAVRQRRRVRAVPIEEPPVFIIGHWRSGTTHLHNLMSRDPRLGSLRMFQTLAPDCSISTRGWLPGLLRRAMPTKRPMDNMEWPMEAPQEEEIALGKTSPYSWYISFLFPLHAIEAFDRYVLLQGASRGVRAEVRDKLHKIYRVATLHEGGRRLLLKNPVHTCRIPLLLEMFPDARFVFIHRCPYEVFASTLNLHRRIIEITALQDIDEERIESNVLELHRRVTTTYLRDRHIIRASHRIEVPYAELVTHPLAVLERIYGHLDLPRFESARPEFARYLESQRGYQTNRFALSERARERVEEAWRDDFAAWGYARQPAAA